jgi:translation initiation factor IF-3
LIGASGEQVGVVSLAAANKLAEEAELDLVEIAPTAVPPVCRVMDYGKYKYREAKKRHEAKLKQKQIIVKEIKFRPGTDEGDYKIKLRNLIRFLEEGDKMEGRQLIMVLAPKKTGKPSQKAPAKAGAPKAKAASPVKSETAQAAVEAGAGSEKK